MAGLEFARQFEVALDRHSIIEGEDWKKRLGALIADADSVLFLLSPDSARSEICVWEIDEAWRLSKRILPVLVRPLGSLSAPERLAALNYVRFDEGRSFMAGLNALVRALNTDVDWLREHTRILSRALEWQAAGRNANRMLTGTDIGIAKAWIARRPKDAPEVTDLQISFIRASEVEEAERWNAERMRLEEVATAQSESATALADREAAVQKLSRRTTFGLISAGGLTTTAGGLAWWGTDAERRFQVERRKAAEAERSAADTLMNQEAMREDIAGQLTVYAAGPDQEALDGPADSNSPFTQSMIEELADERTSLQTAVAKATRKVQALAAKEGHIQRPYLATDLSASIYLFRKPNTRVLKALVVSADRWQGTINGNYTQIASSNSGRDGTAWEGLLRKAGFDVQTLWNPLRDRAVLALADLVGETSESPNELSSTSRLGTSSALPSNKESLIRGNSLAIVFYSGVGFVDGNEPYLGLTGSGFGKADDMLKNAISLYSIQQLLRRRYAASVLVMDTCFTPLRQVRNNQTER